MNGEAFAHFSFYAFQQKVPNIKPRGGSKGVRSGRKMIFVSDFFLAFQTMAATWLQHATQPRYETESCKSLETPPFSLPRFFSFSFNLHVSVCWHTC